MLSSGFIASKESIKLNAMLSTLSSGNFSGRTSKDSIAHHSHVNSYRFVSYGSFSNVFNFALWETLSSYKLSRHSNSLNFEI